MKNWEFNIFTLKFMIANIFWSAKKKLKMKNMMFCIGTILILILSPQTIFAQCEPDTVNCKDVLLPGEICPLILPDGIVNESYEEVFTVIPPNQAVLEYGTIEIVKIVIDTVGNLPPGLNYQTNSDTFYVDTAYCVLLSGTPTTPGIYDLYIRVIPFLYSPLLKIVIPGPPVVDDTSLTIIVRDPTGIDEFRGKIFSVLEAFPNPFETATRIGFFTRNQSPFELRIYNLLGKMIYNEDITGRPGKNYFSFNGIELQPGAYLYNISGGGNSITKKLIRLE
jgi:hypothetical protein